MNYRERVALCQQVKYVHLEGGSVGLVSNSAGTCMAQMDMLSVIGAKASNFLDLGG